MDRLGRPREGSDAGSDEGIASADPEGSEREPAQPRRDSEQSRDSVCVSRRRAVAASATLFTTATAGCSSIPGSSYLPGSSESPPGWTSWLPATPILESATPRITYETLYDLTGPLPENHSRIQELRGLSREYRVGAHQLKGRLEVDTADDVATILLGTFSSDTALQGWDENTSDFGSVEEFTILGDTHAVGPGAIVLASNPRAYVRAHLGDGERLADADEHWSAAVEDVDDGDLARIAAPDDRPFEVIGLSVDVGADFGVEGTAYVHFDSADAASEHADAITSDVADLSADGVDTVVIGRSVSGNVVEVEVGYEDLPF